MGRLDNKIAIVTGAGSGIRRAAPIRFAAQGARVIAGDVTGAEEETAPVIGERGIAVRAAVPPSVPGSSGCRWSSVSWVESRQRQKRSAAWSRLEEMGTADEVALMALFRASDESAFVTGAAFPVDGGSLAC